MLDRRRRLGGAAWPAFVCAEAVIFGLGVLRAGYQDAKDGHYLTAWQNAVRAPLVLVAVSAAVVVAVALVARRSGPELAGTARTLGFLALPVLVVAQGSVFFHTVMPGDDPKAFYPATGDHTFLADHLGHDRFASAQLTLYPATAFYYGLRSATGHQFNDTRWNTMLTTVDPHVMTTPTNSDFSGDIDSGDISKQPLLDQMAVKYFVVPPTDVAGSPEPWPAATGVISTATGPVGCTVPGGPLRGIAVRLAAPLAPTAALGGVTVGATIAGPGYRISTGVYLTGVSKAGSTVTIPVAGEKLPAGGVARVSLTLTGGAGPLVLAASGAGADCSPVRPRDDGLQLVYASPGAVIYQRMGALPRIRWASRAELVPDDRQQLKDMARGVPGSTVLLSGPGPAGSGQPASVAVTEDSGDREAATVTAAGGGYLVVADPLQAAGWSVTVDGRPAPLRPANYVMVAVWVPAGTHHVALTYTAPGQRTGLKVSAAALLVAVAMAAWEVSRAGRRRPAHAARR